MHILTVETYVHTCICMYNTCSMSVDASLCLLCHSRNRSKLTTLTMQSSASCKQLKRLKEKVHTYTFTCNVHSLKIVQCSIVVDFLSSEQNKYFYICMKMVNTAHTSLQMYVHVQYYTHIPSDVRTIHILCLQMYVQYTHPFRCTYSTHIMPSDVRTVHTSLQMYVQYTYPFRCTYSTHIPSDVRTVHTSLQMYVQYTHPFRCTYSTHIPSDVCNCT